jgi:[ribosomal protein S5]-alanine N-acetyltransferase
MGTIGLHQRTLRTCALANKREIGYVLDIPYWGQGIMVEAVNAMLDYAFNDLGLSKVIVDTKKANNPNV